MKKPGKQFKDWSNKAVTLLGMSGVGKTHLASRLPTNKWFHYSGDYRIGTRYLDEPILDEIKRKAMEHPFLRDLLCSDSIYIRNNITLEHLHPISNYIGKIGNSEMGGLSVEEFKYRQRLFRVAEVNAMRDVSAFMVKAREIYGYPHFLNDAGGSICGLSESECWGDLSSKTVVLYLRASETMENTLIRRSIECPKPLYYEEKFLDRNLNEYLETNNLKTTEDMVPDEFVQWVFPKVIEYRKSQYESLAERHGHMVEATALFQVREESDFIDLVSESQI
ncbi:MAG: ATPase [Gammaproteobacteria bacterium]|nr:ATPase [Gammaproteobacteria bacterium]NKB64133.1 ATPase [Gammaproteobacteria bacterium]